MTNQETKSKPSSRLRRWGKRAGVLAALGVTGYFALDALGLLDNFGRVPKGDALARLASSKNYDENTRQFINRLPTTSGPPARNIPGILGRALSGLDRAPKVDIPVSPFDPGAFTQRVTEGTRVTWINHATILIEIDGFRVLTDPVWSQTTSPFSFAGPQRWHPPAIPLERLPEIDAVLISHDHYDHLDAPTISHLGSRGVPFYVPLGIGSHLEHWGVQTFTELDWHESVKLTRGEQVLTLTATPARHFSGRALGTDNTTLWASWALYTDARRVWFGGDTGHDPEIFAKIGEAYGPFELTIVPIGAYDDAWPDIHLHPEQAIEAHKLVRGTYMLPIHWGSFNLAFHPWDEPIERTWKAAHESKISLYVPKPGELVRVGDAPTTEPWWRAKQSGIR